YVRANHEHFAHEVNTRVPEITVIPADSLYLAWMDCRGLGMDAEELQDFMLTKARIWFDQGQKFSTEGRGYMRANLGCPRSTVDEASEPLVYAIYEWTNAIRAPRSQTHSLRRTSNFPNRRRPTLCRKLRPTSRTLGLMVTSSGLSASADHRSPRSRHPLLAAVR